MGSYITQYYNNVIIAFNKNSKYVQINPGEIAIYNYGVENSKKRAVFDETGNHFYRDGYYVGAIGTNQWSGNNAHKGLVFDLEPQGKYITEERMKEIIETAKEELKYVNEVSNDEDEEDE